MLSWYLKELATRPLLTGMWSTAGMLFTGDVIAQQVYIMVLDISRLHLVVLCYWSYGGEVTTVLKCIPGVKFPKFNYSLMHLEMDRFFL